MDKWWKLTSFKIPSFSPQNGRDEKGCKIDVDGRRRTSTVDQVEKSRMVNVDRLKNSKFWKIKKISFLQNSKIHLSYLVDVNRRRRRQPVKKCSLPFSIGWRWRLPFSLSSAGSPFHHAPQNWNLQSYKKIMCCICEKNHHSNLFFFNASQIRAASTVAYYFKRSSICYAFLLHSFKVYVALFALLHIC